MLVPLLVVLAAAPAAPDAGTSATPAVGPATPARGSGPEKLPFTSDTLRERVAPGARDRDRSGQFPAELLAEMAELGLLGVNVPSAYGGAEAGATSYALAMMEVAEACASTAVAMAVTNMCAELITAFGTEQQKQRHVTRLTSGKAVAGAFALSEAQAGSDASALETRAQRTGDGWVLNGSKQW